MDILANLNLQGIGELQNANIQNLAAAPTTNLRAGRIYFNTTDHTLYVYNGTAWVDALSQGDYTFKNGIELVTNTRDVQIKLATGNNAGNITLTADTNGLAGSAPTASTSQAGLIEIATDEEVSTGTDTSRAVTPKQLAGKVDKLATAPTAGTYTKVTINGDGLVSSGGTLEASDIPNLTLSKITDITATAAEVNVLDGITASTAELNIMDGVTVTASDINSVTSKIALTDLSIASGSTNYLEYDNTSGTFGAKVDTTVTDSSTNLVTSGAVSSAIASAIVGGVIYKGTWAITSATTDYSGITLPVKKGYMYYVTGSGSPTVGGIEWNPGDYLLVNEDVAAGGSLSGKVEKIDNTESADIVRTSATQTLTNKTIDGDNNTIQDLSTSVFKSGVLQTTVRAASSASDTALASEKAIATALGNKTGKITATNTALTVSGGICTWTISNTLGTADVLVSVYEVSTNNRVVADISASSSSVVIKFNATGNISADTYRAVIIG